MIIAIPSVTSYIQNSRKEAYTKTAVNYADAVIKEVNSGKNFRLYSTSTLYMIPVGHEKGKSCVTLESGGQSPFSDEWNYAFVGVTYDGKGYNYYFIGEDKAGQGISMIDKKTLTDDGTDYIYSSYASTLAATAAKTDTMTSAFATTLAGLYASETNTSHTGCAEGATDCTPTITTEEETVITAYVEGKETGKEISKIEYISPKTCSLTESVTANNP